MQRIIIILLFSSFGNWCYSQTNPIDSILISLKDEKVDSNIYNAYLKIAEFYKDSAYNKTLEYYNKALDIVEQTHQRKQVGDIYHRIGSLYLLKGELPTALTNYNNALKVREFLKDVKGVGEIFNDIGLVYKTWGKYEKAIEYFIKALKIFEETANPEFIAITSNNIGQVFYYRENYESAIIYFKKYLDYNKRIKKPRAVAGAANNIASALMEQKKYDDALNYFVISMRIYDSLNIKIGVAIIKDNIGSLFLRKEQYNDALMYSSEASQIFEKLGSQSRLCPSLQNIGLAYSKLKKTESALTYLNQSLELAIKLNLTETKKDIYETLSDVYIQKKDYEKAYLNFKLFSEIKDSLLNAETIGKIETIQAEYESQKKEKDLAEVNQKFNKQKTLGLIAAGVIILFLFLTSLIIKENIVKKTTIKNSNEQLDSISKAIEKITNIHIHSQFGDKNFLSLFQNHWFIYSSLKNNQFLIPYQKDSILYIAFISNGFDSKLEKIVKLAIIDFFNASMTNSNEASLQEQFSKFISNDETWMSFNLDKQVLNVDFWCFNQDTNQHLYSGNIGAFHINEMNQVKDLSKSPNSFNELKKGNRLFFCTSQCLNSFILSDQNSIQGSINKTIEKSASLNFQQQKEIVEDSVELLVAANGQNARISILAIQV